MYSLVTFKCYKHQCQWYLMSVHVNVSVFLWWPWICSTICLRWTRANAALQNKLSKVTSSKTWTQPRCPHPSMRFSCCFCFYHELLLSNFFHLYQNYFYLFLYSMVGEQIARYYKQLRILREISLNCEI